MFRKSIEAVIADGTRNLEAMVKFVADKTVEAKAEISRCQSEIQTLANLAKQVPEKVFDRYSQVLISTTELYNEDPYFSGSVNINNCHSQLRGVMGDEKIRKGKYRLIVLMEPIS